MNSFSSSRRGQAGRWLSEVQRAPELFEMLKRVTLMRDPGASSANRNDIIEALGFFCCQKEHLEIIRDICGWQQKRRVEMNPASEEALRSLLAMPMPDNSKLSLATEDRPLIARLLAKNPPLKLRYPDIYSGWQLSHFFDKLHQAGCSVPGQEHVAEAVAADLALQLVSTEQKGSVRCLLHGKEAWGSMALARALADALVSHQGYRVLEIDCSAYRHEGEAASWDGSKSYWSGSSPGEVTSFISQHPKAVIVFRRIDETLPAVMAALRPALGDGQMVDNFGLNSQGSKSRTDDRKGKSGRKGCDADMIINTRQAVFIFTAEYGSDWLTHPQVDTILGDTPAQRSANLVGELKHATREYRGEYIRRFDVAVLQALSNHHHLLSPVSWKVLHAHAVRQWYEVRQQVRQQLGQTVLTASAEVLDDLVSLLLLSHGAEVSLAHAQPEALYRAAFQPLQIQRMKQALGAVTTAMPLEVGLTPAAQEQWRKLQAQLGADPVATLRRRRMFVRLQFSARQARNGRATVAWCVEQVSLEPVRVLADYTGSSGMVSRIPDERFADVCGHEDAKQYLRSVIAQLKAPGQLAKLGIQPPRGVMLYGPPGTGKTLLARALAGEAQLPFISIMGTELLNPEAVRRVYEVAHRNEPCVIHIDEADALGCRGKQSPVHDAAINFLLGKIDGFSSPTGIFHVLTSNRPNELDAALLRPGRIENSFLVGALDRQERQQQLDKFWPLLQVSDAQMAEVQEALLEQTQGMTGAELKQLYAEVVRYALGERLGADADDALSVPKLAPETVFSIVGRLRFGDALDYRLDESIRRRIAVHEAGHALLQCLLLPQLPISQVTIVPRQQAAGAVISRTEQQDYPEETASVIGNRLAVLLAGRAAEIMLYGPQGVSSGALGDLKNASDLAHKAVTVYGLDAELGCLSLPTLGNAPSESLRQQVEQRVRHWLETAAGNALSLLNQYRHLHQAIVQALLQRETLYGSEISQLFADSGVTLHPQLSGEQP
ncbi:hypothetical protein CO610_02130 [Lysobacteraceae bacterium NML95-0200]|nr:hypothetical protein CO610_02130 [Xanthomonadaceae bacterium NML95-0200]